MKAGDYMAKVSTNISIDADTKAKAQALLAEFGMDLSTAVNVFLKQMIRENAIPFTINAEVPNAETRAAMEAAEKGEDMYGPFDSVADLMEALNA
jgi:DNA-damage-inducible protein J